MAGYLADVRKAKNYAEFKKMHPDVDITREGFLDLKRRGRTLSDADLSKRRKDIQGTGSIGTGSMEFLNRNDGGIASKTRRF